MGIVYLMFVALVVVAAVGTAILVHQLLHPPRKTFGTALARGLPTDPGALGLSFSPCRFELPDGHKTDGWQIEGRDKEGPLVIFSHGWGDSRFGALTWVSLAAPHVSRIVVYDLRGHGDSPASVCRLGTTEAWDLLAVMDQLRPDGLEETQDGAAAPGRPVVLWGHSMGAGVSIAAAALDARHEAGVVHGVIADGACPTMAEPISGMMRSRRLPAFPFVFLAMRVLGLFLGNLGRHDRAALAAQIRCPLLLLHGSADPFCSLRGAQRIADAADEAHLVAIEGGTHSDLAQVDPGGYGAQIESFLKRVDGDQNSASPTPSGQVA